MLKQPPQYLVMAAVLFTSASSIFIRLSIMPPLVIAFYRMAISAALLAVPLVYRKGQLNGISHRDLLLCGLSGLALALHFATWIASLSMTTVMASTVLVSCSPIFVAVLNGVFFKKKPGKVLLFCLATAFAGTIIITTGAGDGQGLASLQGNLLALAGAASVSVYLIIGQEVRKRVTTAAYSFLVYGASAVILLFFCIIFAQPLAPYSLGQFANIAAMAVVCSIGGHTLYNMLLKFHGAFLVSLATLCEPLFASILAIIILSEIPPIQTVLGGALVIAGLVAYIVKNRSD
ncbi:MAG: DMT family transporter [Defluviitaleaceae bacterium]|nr:DMT family transporter [Defluviitaleaceae bacterium]